MGASVCWTVALFSLLGLFYGAPGVSSQDLNERDALCNEDGCFVVYFERKTFLDSWRSCKEKGGNLATAKRQEEADTIAALFSAVELRGSRTKVRVWIGLQRQPRQCSATRPLRGYSWTTGDKDTQYTNWLREDSPSTCSAPRCVVMSYSTVMHEQHENFKWLDGSCSVPMDGYLCRYTYKGMCPAVWSEGGGNALYTTPFNLLSSLLTHLPFGSVATVPCPAGTKDEQQSVLCMLREDGTVGWSKDAPLCTDDAPVDEEDWCTQDNGGCEHYCREAGAHYFCECSQGFRLADDGQSCLPADPCQDAPCEFECLPLSDGYRCACPEGYMLAPDEQGCLDVDECLQSPCEQLCVNAPGTFECRCREGYRLDEEGECEDVDECVEEDPCEHACENTPGSHVCHCHLGFSPLAEDSRRCQDMDECQIPETCEQMCVNYEGGYDCYCEVGYELTSDNFSCRKIGENEGPATATPAWVTHHPDPVWDPLDPDYHWTAEQGQTGWTPEQGPTDWTPEEGQTDWTPEEEGLDWLTDPPRSDVIWVTSIPQERPTFNPTADPPTEEPEEETEVPDWLDSREEEEWETTPGSSTTPPPTPTLTPDWYGGEEEEVEEEEEEEEESTTSPTPIPTTTISEGAWNWLPANQDPVHPMWEEPIIEQNTPEPEYSDKTDRDEYEDVTTGDSSQFHVGVEEEVGEEGNEEYKVEVTSFPTRDTLSQPAPPSFAPGQGVVESKGVGEGAKDSEQSQGGSWLLVGLLVPLCIFVVIMVALGIVYCTRCAVQPRNKSATDCYHWISGAHDKQGAPSPSTGVKTHV